MKLKKNLRTAATLARDAAEQAAAGAMDTLNSSPVQATTEAIASGARAVRTAGSQVAGQAATLARDTAGHAAGLATDAVNSKAVQATTGAIATSAQASTDAIATGARAVRTAGSQVAGQAATLARDTAGHAAGLATDAVNSKAVQATTGAIATSAQASTDAIATGARAVRTAGSQVAGQAATLARDTAGHAAGLATDAVNSKAVQATTGAIATSAQASTDAIATGARAVRTAGSQVAGQAATLARDTAGHAAGLATDAMNSKAVQGTTGAIATGAAAVGSAGSQVADYMCEIPGWTRDAIAKAANSPAAAAGFTAAATTAWYIDGFTKSLDWSSIDPTKYLYAGTRGASRGMTEALRVWEQIPEQIRMRGPESTAEYLDGKDWSHIRAHSAGGSNLASNGVWEDAAINRARGAEQMTGTEIAAAADVANSAAFRAALASAAESALTGGLAGAAVAGLLAILEEFLRFQRREIDESTMWNAIGRRIARSAATGAVVAGLLTLAVTAFPALAPIAAWLLIPVSVLGFAMYASRLAAAAAGLYEVATNGERLRKICKIEKRLMLEAAGS